MLFGESFDFVKFVFEDSFVKISGYADVEGAGEASENVGAVAAVMVYPGHGGSRGSLGYARDRLFDLVLLR